MRLTSKLEDNWYCVDFVKSEEETYRNVINKLGQLEDIEEEFEIDSLEDLRDRLTTYKFLANHEMSCVDANAYNLMLEDLNKYHSLEEELGIDLVTFFKIRKHCHNRKPIFIKGKDGIAKSSCRVELCYKSVAVHTGDYGADLYPLKNYGKTWALTKEELL